MFIGLGYIHNLNTNIFVSSDNDANICICNNFLRNDACLTDECIQAHFIANDNTWLNRLLFTYNEHESLVFGSMIPQHIRTPSQYLFCHKIHVWMVNGKYKCLVLLIFYAVPQRMQKSFYNPLFLLSFFFECRLFCWHLFNKMFY